MRRRTAAAITATWEASTPSHGARTDTRFPRRWRCRRWARWYSSMRGRRSKHFLDGGHHLGSIKWLLDRFDCAETLGDAQQRRHAGFTRHGDDRDIWEVPSQFLDCLQSLFLRHEKVRDDQFHRLATKLLKPFLAIAGHRNIVTGQLEHLLQQFPHGHSVVDDKNSSHFRNHTPLVHSNATTKNDWRTQNASPRREWLISARRASSPPP